MKILLSLLTVLLVQSMASAGDRCTQNESIRTAVKNLDLSGEVRETTKDGQKILPGYTQIDENSDEFKKAQEEFETEGMKVIAILGSSKNDTRGFIIIENLADCSFASTNGDDEMYVTRIGKYRIVFDDFGDEVVIEKVVRASRLDKNFMEIQAP